MVANGIANEQIAQLLEISADTLTKYYRKELDTGESKAVALMARSLYRRGLKGDTVAALFWLKAKGKWRDRDPMNVSVAQILPNSDVPKLDSRQVEDAIYTALSRMRPNAKQQPALLEHNQ
jgi:hypothetical protein